MTTGTLKVGGPTRAYHQRVRDAVRAHVPADANVAVVSRGETELLELGGRPARHFPGAEDGSFLGYHPADSADAVAELKRAMAAGVEFLVFPVTTLWWLGYYTGLRAFLQTNSRPVAYVKDACLILALGDPGGASQDLISHAAADHGRAGESEPAAKPQAAKPEAPVKFRCNICGADTEAPPERMGREVSSCQNCASTARFRSVIHVLSIELFGESLALPDFPERPDLVGLGMTDWGGYADPLAKKLGYRNTFYHQEPRLDIVRLDPALEGSCDFVISSEVFEHVPPPVSVAFANLRRLLKPGGVVVFTVPFGPTPATVEHFPDLYEYEIVETGGRHVLKNKTRSGQLQTFEDLVFHGGPGETLEMRQFSETALVRDFQRAGFRNVRIYRESYPPFGIIWEHDWSLPMSARLE